MHYRQRCSFVAWINICIGINVKKQEEAVKSKIITLLLSLFSHIKHIVGQAWTSKIAKEENYKSIRSSEVNDSGYSSPVQWILLV